MSVRDSSLASARRAPQDRPPVLVWHDRAPEYVHTLRGLLPGVEIEGWASTRCEKVAIAFSYAGLAMSYFPKPRRRSAKCKWIVATSCRVLGVSGVSWASRS